MQPDQEGELPVNKSANDELNQLARIVLQRLEGLQRAGVQTLPAAVALPPLIPPASPSHVVPVSPPASTSSRFVLTPVSAPPGRGVAPSSPAPPTTTAGNEAQQPREDSMARRRAKSPTENSAAVPHFPAGATLNQEERTTALQALSCEVASCQLCPVLVKNRTQTVFGVGNVTPRVVFFGEAPGADEDREGEPFVGKAGQLLTKIIEACTFKREEVYILNVLKCRPPDNRAPLEDEVENCRHFFEKQLEILRPEYIVCVGATPLKALLRTNKTVGQMRGKFHEWNGSKVVITYHPAYLLRNPDAKRHVWDDMKMLLKEMGIVLPGTTQGNA